MEGKTLPDVIYEINEKIINGNNFFDLLVQSIQIIKELPDTHVSQENALKHILLLTTTKIEIALFEAFQRAGFDKDTSFSEMKFIMEKLFGWTQTNKPHGNCYPH